MYNSLHYTLARAILDSDFREMVLKIESKKEKKLIQKEINNVS